MLSNNINLFVHLIGLDGQTRTTLNKLGQKRVPFHSSELQDKGLSINDVTAIGRRNKGFNKNAKMHYKIFKNRSSCVT